MNKIAEFLKHFGDDFFIQTFDDKKKGNRYALTERCWSLQDIEQKQAALHRLNENHDAGVYFCVNSLKAKARRNSDNIDGVRAFFIDLDGAKLQPVIDWGEKDGGLLPNIVVCTSNERWHCYWLLDDYYPNAIKLFRDYQRWLAEKFKGDHSVIDLCRVMRLPCFFNMKHEPFMVEWVPMRQKPYTLEEIKNAYDADKNNRRDTIIQPGGGAFSIETIPDWATEAELAADTGKGGIANAVADFEFDEKRLRGALLGIPADDYDIWLRVGMALQGAARRDDAELSEEEAYEYWLSWSETSNKFDESTIEEKWQGLNARGELGLGTIFELAKQNGWQGHSASSWTTEEVIEKERARLQPISKLKIDLTTPEGIEAERRRLGIIK